jgi:hypothetical protein
VACVSAANAAFLSIDDFQTAGSAVGTSSPSTYGQYVDETASFGLAPYRQISGQYWGNATNSKSSSVVIGSGSMTMSYGGTKTGSGSWRNALGGGTNYGTFPSNGESVNEQVATAGWDVQTGTPANWSTLTSLSFDIANYTKGGLISANSPRLRLSLGFLTDPTDWTTTDFRVFNITLANGSVSLSNSDLTSAGVNLSGMLGLSMYLENTYTTALTLTTGVGNIPSASLDISNFGVSGVPAPGAIALLGAAGLIGARRRRA